MGHNLRKVSQFIEKQQLLSPGEKVLVGVSGGSDSVALLLMLCRLGYKCIVVHCNFHLRGEESDRDQAFVLKLCNQLNVTLNIGHFCTEQIARKRHLSIEMAARELRYDWFEELRKEYGVESIAIAHHRDDSIETLLLNLIRGTGINGLCGIRPHNGHIIRPLLCLSRTDVLDYLQHLDQTFVTDSSNLHDEFTRNKIRLSLLPLMEEINPSVRESLQQTAAHLYEASLVYNHAIADGRRRVMLGEDISIAALLKEPSPKALLFELLYPLGFNSSQAEDVYESLQGQPGKEFVSTSHRVVKDRELLLVRPLYNKVKVGEEPPFHIVYEELPYTPSFEIPRGTDRVCFDADKLNGELSLRKWQQGDKFVPFGMRGKKLVSDFLTDCKRSVVQKEAQWLLCCDNQIAWVVGLRTDNRYRIDASTKRIMIATITKK